MTDAGSEVPPDSRPQPGSAPQVSVNQRVDTVAGGKVVGIEIHHVDTLITATGQFATPPIVPPPHVLPSPVADFTGRAADIEELVAHLRSDNAIAAGGNGAAITGLRGMGGIGKTQLALAAAQRLRDAYSEQFMFELQPGGLPLTPETLLGRAIHAFQPELKLPDAVDELQGLYRGLLQGRQGLLLLDNAANGAQVRPFLPPPAGWAIIVTSRSRFRLDGGKLHEVELLSADDATSLLARMLTDGERPDLAGADLGPLAELCGRLPLALRLAAGYLSSTGRSLESYLKGLRRARLKYLNDPEAERPETAQSVRAVLGLSVDRLDKKAADLARRWRDLAVFPAPFDVAAAAAVWAMEHDDAHDVLDVLHQQSLIEQDADLYSVHDLLRELALEAPPADEAYYRHAKHYLERGSAANDLYPKGQVLAGLRAFDALLPHLRAAYLWMGRQPTRSAAQWLDDFPGRTMNLLDLRTTPSERIDILRRSLEAARDLSDRRGEGHRLGSLGLAYRGLGRVEQAIDYHEQALAISRELKDRQGEGNDLGNLGSAYRDLGRVEQAIAYYEQALAISREIGDRRGEGNRLGSLGNAYRELGQPERAIECLQQALAISREIEDRRAEGHHLGNLGLVYTDLGRAEQAIEYLQQALAINREIENRQGEGNDLGNLGLAYAGLGRTEEAIGYYLQALPISQEVKDRRGEANRLGNLGNAYRNLGRADQAVEYLQRALTISREIKDRPAEGTWLGSLGLAYVALGRAEQAIEHYQQALAITREVGNRSREGNHLGNLGLAYASLGDTQEAIEYHQQALTISHEIGDRRGEAIHSWNLGRQYEKVGDLQLAADLMQVRVEYERGIGHSDAQAHAEMVGEIRRRAAQAGDSKDSS